MPARRIWYAAAGTVAIVISIVSIAFATGLLAPGPTAEAPPTVRSPVSSPSPSLTPRPTATRRPKRTPRPSPTNRDSGILDGRFTMLVLGTDMNAARRAAGDSPRTDAIIIVSVNGDHDEILVMSLPRDTVDISMPDGSTWSRKINALYAERGGDGLRRTLELLLGLDIDRYVAVDMDGFRRIVDALGGVTLDVETDLADPTIGFYLSSGKQRLDGPTALRYARHRAQGGDYARAARQQRFLFAMGAMLLEQPHGDAMVLDLTELMDTDVTRSDVSDLLELARQSAGADVNAIVFKPPEFAVFEGIAGHRGWIMIPDIRAMRAWVTSAVD